MEQEVPKDKDVCLAGPRHDPTWMVKGPDKAVQNVVVFLRPPAGKFFKVPDDRKKSVKTVFIDQPHCAFEPHVEAVYASYFDPQTKAQVRTGEKLEVRNSATIPHNTNYKGDDVLNAGTNKTIAPKGDPLPIEPKASSPSKTGQDIIRIACDIHKWMTGFVWVFDHPYFAITKEDGSFEIKGVPTGVELEIVYWHESFGARPNHAKVLEKATLKDGDNTKDIKIK
jgi:hypothetical protein